MDKAEILKMLLKLLKQAYCIDPTHQGFTRPERYVDFDDLCENIEAMLLEDSK